jgi:hypothetical protein
MNTIARYFKVLATPLLAVALLAGQAPLSGKQNDAAFQQEVRLADQAVGRRARVKHLQRAIELRPDHPENIALEYRIGIALAQHGDPTDGSDPNPPDAIPWFEGILAKYNHMDYYEPRASTGSWDAQFLVPRAAVQLASILLGDPAAAHRRREILLKAMEDIQSTYDQRIEDWLSEPRPEPPHPALGGLDPMGKWHNRQEEWLQRRQAAERGDVLHEVEMRTVKAAVRQYGYTYGRQQPWEVRRAMQDIIDRFPNTPMGGVTSRL